MNDQTRPESPKNEVGVWHDKVWGRTQCLVRSPFYFRYELELKENTFCSFHYHRGRANKFSLESGVVKIVWAFGWNIRWHVLSAGEEFTVDSLTPHQFQVLVPGKMFEEYYSDRTFPNIFEDDIERLTIGGESNLVQRNEGLVFNQDGKFWSGEPQWSTLPSSGLTAQPSDNSD